MPLAYEPLAELAEEGPHGVRLLGIESLRRPRWPALRHVYDVGHDGALHIEIDAFGGAQAFAVGYTRGGEEMLTPL